MSIARSWRPWPRSLLGQVLLAVALALLAAQALSAFLLIRAGEEAREAALFDALADRMVAGEHLDPGRELGRRPRPERGGLGRIRVRTLATLPAPLDVAPEDPRAEELRARLTASGIAPADVRIATIARSEDPFRDGTRRRFHSAAQGEDRRVVLAAMRRPGATEWVVARAIERRPGQRALGGIVLQTAIIYLVLVGLLALLLRRVTRPLAALKARSDRFGADGGNGSPSAPPLTPQGPDDVRGLIESHNAMETRIGALLDEKDVMLGAIGHDLKTPLAALRVRLESVENEAQRAKMVAGIEDIVRTLDDILSLARVGRASDPSERTELSALVASVVEEYEDMGEPVELGRTERIALPLRATWVRRALRNLIGNAMRYGSHARVDVERAGEHALIRVADAGPGIPDHAIADMLEPFRRGEASRNRATGGAGLGLTLARAIAENHGGTLQLANASDAEGRTIGLIAEISLPLA